MSDALAPVITIDGPSSSGKGTISQMLAKKLRWHFLDSGALYRVLAYAAQLHAVELSNHQALEVLASHLDVQFKANKIGIPPHVILEGNDVTDVIRNEECGRNASVVSAIKGVREALLERQRAFRQHPGLVADGRDMGTVIFPDAKLKIFLTASVEVRAERRVRQLNEKGVEATFDQILHDLTERDTRDRSRIYAPMMPAPEAIIIDTTGLSIEEGLNQVLLEKEKYFNQ
jgi:cytidylate kinase